jgi:hypothetical protein
MAFVTFRAKWKLEQLHILRALPLNGWAIALLTSNVHAEHALDCHNGSIWRTLNGSEAEFDFMLLLKGGMVTHDVAAVIHNAGYVQLQVLEEVDHDPAKSCMNDASCTNVATVAACASSASNRSSYSSTSSRYYR